MREEYRFSSASYDDCHGLAFESEFRSNFLLTASVRTLWIGKRDTSWLATLCLTDFGRTWDSEESNSIPRFFQKQGRHRETLVHVSMRDLLTYLSHTAVPVPALLFLIHALWFLSLLDPQNYLKSWKLMTVVSDKEKEPVDIKQLIMHGELG